MRVERGTAWSACRVTCKNETACGPADRRRGTRAPRRQRRWRRTWPDGRM